VVRWLIRKFRISPSLSNRPIRIYAGPYCDLDQMFHGSRGLVVDCPCGKFGDCSFSDVDKQTDADERITHATTVGVSNKSTVLDQTCSFSGQSIWLLKTSSSL